jgi:thioredoxin 2
MVYNCPSCGASNRIPDNAAGKTVRCGRCKTTLIDGARPLTVTDANFGELVERSSLPVLLDLWAEWCGPCHMLAPTVDQLSKELAGRIRVAKLNIDENPSTANRFGVRSIPMLLIFQNGREVDRIVGVQPKPEIVRRLEAVTSRS